MLYIGIDPGDAHLGFAALEITSGGEVRVESRTYSVEAHGGYARMAHDIIDLLPHAKRTHIVCEDFRIRKIGHQAHSAGRTLRLIGALEYGALGVKEFSFSTLPATDKVENLTRELFGRVLFNYRNHWPRSRHSSWRHCLSAWRVLGEYLFTADREWLMEIRKKKRSHACERWLPVSEKKPDHVAGAAIWIKR